MISWIEIEIIGLIAFFSLVFLFILIEKRKNRVEFKYGIIILRYKRFSKKIKDFVNKNRKVLNALGFASICLSFALSIFGTYYIVSCAIYSQACFAIVLPTVGGYKIPGPVISVPIFAWLTILPILLIPHEFSHAIYSLYSKVKVKSYGLIFLFLLPIGAFVDPDNRKFKRIKTKEKLFILSIGTFSNFLTFLLIFLILFILGRFIVAAGIDYDVIENSPAYEAKLSGSILKINNTEVKDFISLIKFLNKTKPNQTLEIETTKGKFVVKLVEHKDFKDRGFLGITNITQKFEYNFFGFVFPVGWESNYLIFLATVTLGISIANSLPIKPLDGGLIFEEILKKYFGSKKAKSISNYVSLLLFFILLYNLYLTSKFGFPLKLF